MTEHPEEKRTDLPEGEPTAERPEVGHEYSDVSARGILLSGGIMVISAIVIQLAVWGLYEYFGARESRDKPSAFPLAVEQSRQPIERRLDDLPGPHLEGLELTRGNDFNLHGDELNPNEYRRLRDYGWVDQKAGVVHVPVDVAIQLALQQHWITVAKGAGDLAAADHQPPSASNSGRPVRRGGR